MKRPTVADLTAMMKAQLELQIAKGTNPLNMTLNERVQYIKDQVLACTDELHEALKEVGWKPWASKRFIDENPAFGELRDAWQFLTNLMFAVTLEEPEQLADRLEANLYEKLAINHRRVTEGYDGVSSKCPGCSRALDETPTHEILDADGYKTFCSGCGTLLGVSPIPA